MEQQPQILVIMNKFQQIIEIIADFFLVIMIFNVVKIENIARVMDNQKQYQKTIKDVIEAIM